MKIKAEKPLRLKVNSSIVIGPLVPATELAGSVSPHVVEKYKNARLIKASENAIYMAAAYGFCEKLREDPTLLSQKFIEPLEKKDNEGLHSLFDKHTLNRVLKHALKKDFSTLLDSFKVSQRLISIISKILMESKSKSIERIADCLDTNLIIANEGAATQRPNPSIASPIILYEMTEATCYLLYPFTTYDPLVNALSNVVKGQRKLFSNTIHNKAPPSTSDLFTAFWFPKSLFESIKRLPKSIIEALTEDIISSIQQKTEAFLEKLPQTFGQNLKELAATSFKSSVETTVELSCGHKFLSSVLKSYCIYRKSRMKQGPFIALCPLCEKNKRYQFLTTAELATIFVNDKKEFDALYENCEALVEQCMLCGAVGTDVNFIHSNHAICKECLQFYIRQREPLEKNHDAKIKCPGCEFRFVYNYDINLEEFKMEYSLLYPFGYESKIAPATVPQKSQICDKCGALCLNEQANKVYKCSHTVCKGCVCKALKTCCESKGTFLDCRCPVAGCVSNLSIAIILENRSKSNVAEKLIRRGLEGCPLNSLVICPNAECLHRLVPENENSVQTCKNCKATFCLKCGVNHAAGPCGSRKQYRGALQKVYEAFFEMLGKACGEKIRVFLVPCPYCLKFAPAIPDIVEVLQCTNPACKRVFCADQSCKMDLINSYGPSYHRPKCRFFKDSPVIADVPSASEENKKAGKPPRNLDEEGDIPVDERI